MNVILSLTVNVHFLVVFLSQPSSRFWLCTSLPLSAWRKRIRVKCRTVVMEDAEELELDEIHFQTNALYLELAKGAYIISRVKWLEEGERNSSYFFVLEKRNGNRKPLSALNIDGAVCKDLVQIYNFVTHLYSNLYSSKCDANSCDSSLDKIQCCIPAIDDDYESYYESEFKYEEVWKALQSMKKGNGLSVELYTHFWDSIKIPLVKMY